MNEWMNEETSKKGNDIEYLQRVKFILICSIDNQSLLIYLFCHLIDIIYSIKHLPNFQMHFRYFPY